MVNRPFQKISMRRRLKFWRMIGRTIQRTREIGQTEGGGRRCALFVSDGFSSLLVDLIQRVGIFLHALTPTCKLYDGTRTPRVGADIQHHESDYHCSDTQRVPCFFRIWGEFWLFSTLFITLTISSALDTRSFVRDVWANMGNAINLRNVYKYLTRF